MEKGFCRRDTRLGGAAAVCPDGQKTTMRVFAQKQPVGPKPALEVDGLQQDMALVDLTTFVGPGVRHAN